MDSVYHEVCTLPCLCQKFTITLLKSQPRLFTVMAGSHAKEQL